jgi:hypothetical protein
LSQQQPDVVKTFLVGDVREAGRRAGRRLPFAAECWLSEKSSSCRFRYPGEVTGPADEGICYLGYDIGGRGGLDGFHVAGIIWAWKG